ncbi:CD209 antigen-like [Conger conger]|uniref:CD209 antigen-like n=1 Tax=Conger conger TaxID=82655 RepID=UPI002A5AD5A3|nr:CD209 antigen-like [Conger conger]
MAASTTIIPEGTYANLDSPDHHVYSTVNPTTQKNSGPRKTGKRLAVALGLLCVILLTATITLCVLYMTALDGLKAQNGTCCYEKDQRQKEYNRLSTAKDQLQNDYNSLSTVKDRLQNDYNSLCTAKDQLHNDYNSLCTAKDQLQNDYNSLCTAKDQLHNDYNSLCTAKDQLQNDYNSLCTAKDQLQNDYNSLSTAKDQLQKDYDNLMRQCRPTPPSSSCPESWKSFSSKCYLFTQTKQKWDDCRTYCKEQGADLVTQMQKSWNDNHKYCKEQGADLVIINNEDEQNFTNQNAVEGEYWIGLHDPDPNKSCFRWVDGTRPQTTFWKPGAPDEQRNHEECVFTGPGALSWGSTHCYQPRRCICERKPYAVSLQALAAVCHAGCYLKPMVLTDLMHPPKVTGCKPSCPESWKSFPSKCYLFTQTQKSWSDCRTHCKGQGADLVIINTEDQQNFINQNAVEGEYWIGLYDPDPNKSFFRWVDGTRPQKM